MRMVTLDFYHRKSFENICDAVDVLEWLASVQRFCPEKWSAFEPVNKQFNSDSLIQAAEVFSNFENMQGKKVRDKWSGMLLLKRTKSPRSSFFLEWNNYRKNSFAMSYFEVAETWLNNATRMKEFLDFSDGLYSLFDGFWFASIASDDERRAKRELKWFRPDNNNVNGGYFICGAPGIFLEKGIPGIFWGNYFGPFYVDWLGREKFRTLPCFFKKEMPNGGIFFTLSESVGSWGSEESLEMEKRVKEHLGMDAFFDLSGLRRRVEEAISSGGVIDNDLPKRLIGPCRIPAFPDRD